MRWPLQKMNYPVASSMNEVHTTLPVRRICSIKFCRQRSSVMRNLRKLPVSILNFLRPSHLHKCIYNSLVGSLAQALKNAGKILHVPPVELFHNGEIRIAEASPPAGFLHCVDLKSDG